MRRQFCDRCGQEITGKTSGVVHGIKDGDEDGNGKVTEAVDLCPPCYRAWKAWIVTKPDVARKRSRPFQRKDDR